MGDNLGAITLGLGNDYLSKSTSVWNILWAKSWTALLGILLEFAELERPLNELGVMAETEEPAEGKSPEPTS